MKARDKLLRLKQTKSVAAYLVEFQEIIVHLNLNNDAKQPAFLLWSQGCNQGRGTIGEEQEFLDFVDQVIVIDQRQYQSRMEEKKTVKPQSRWAQQEATQSRSSP